MGVVMMKTKPFNVVDFLNTEEEIQEYLKSVLESGASMKAVRKAFDDAECARAKLQNQEPNIATVDMIFKALINNNKLTSIHA